MCDIVNDVKVMQEELQFVTNTLKTKEIEINESKEKVNELENIFMEGEFQQSKMNSSVTFVSINANLRQY